MSSIDKIIQSELKRQFKDAGLKDMAIKLYRATSAAERKSIIDEFTGIKDEGNVDG